MKGREGIYGLNSYYLISQNMFFSKILLLFLTLFFQVKSIEFLAFTLHKGYSLSQIIFIALLWCCQPWEIYFLSNECKLLISRMSADSPSFFLWILTCWFPLSFFCWPSYSKYVNHSQDSMRHWTLVRVWQHGPWTPGFKLWQLVKSAPFPLSGVANVLQSRQIVAEVWS